MKNVVLLSQTMLKINVWDLAWTTLERSQALFRASMLDSLQPLTTCNFSSRVSKTFANRGTCTHMHISTQRNREIKTKNKKSEAGSDCISLLIFRLSDFIS